MANVNAETNCNDEQYQGNVYESGKSGGLFFGGRGTGSGLECAMKRQDWKMPSALETAVGRGKVAEHCDRPSNVLRSAGGGHSWLSHYLQIQLVDTRKKVFSAVVLQLRNSVPREACFAPSLPVFRKLAKVERFWQALLYLMRTPCSGMRGGALLFVIL